MCTAMLTKFYTGHLDKPPKERPAVAAWMVPQSFGSDLPFKSRKSKKTVMITPIPFQQENLG